MKPSLPLVAALVLLLTAPACTNTPTNTPTTAPTTDATTPTHDPETRIAELQALILSLREESFIARAEYEARIRALEDQIDALQAQLDPTDTPTGTDIPVSGSPDQTESPDEAPPAMAFQFEMRDGHAVILAYLGDEPHVTVPAAIEGYPVTTVADAAFKGAPIQSVTLPYSVTEIGWFAFADCQALTSVTLPASVESIGYGAFDGCPALTLYCPADSYAAQYAASFGLRHKEP